MIDIEYYTSEATTLLNSLIGIPSLSREEEAAADFLQNYIEETGIMTGRSGNNIWCISPMFDLNKPTILLNSHIDTVKPVNGWRKHPFTPKAHLFLTRLPKADNPYGSPLKSLQSPLQRLPLAETPPFCPQPIRHTI